MDALAWVSVLMIGSGLIWMLYDLCKRKRSEKPPPDPLDRVLFHWTQPDDPCTLRDLLTSVAVFGRTGSGKTSSSGKLLAEAIIAFNTGEKP